MPVNAKLVIEAALRNGKTVLRKTYCTPPFKIANITENRQQKSLHLVLMSSSPGILDGDDYNLHVILHEGASLVLGTQSYQRLFQMRTGASQQFCVRLNQGSSFAYLPHPLVPHQQAVFRSRTQIFMNENCSLLWGEIMSCGRKLNNEIFRFSLYHGITEIFYKDKLVVKENLFISPAETDLAAIGQLEAFTHQATLLFINPHTNVTAVIEAITNHLTGEKDISFGVSALPVNGLVVRLLGHKAEQVFSLLQEVALLINTPSKSLSPIATSHVA